jgi:hypothetical protein
LLTLGNILVHELYEVVGEAHLDPLDAPEPTHVSTEMSLHVLAYNLKRVINLFGTTGWIAKMQAA